MKYILMLFITICASIFVVSCKKVNEVPPRDQTVIREYFLPSAPFLTTAEREILNQKRDEYQSIL